MLSDEAAASVTAEERAKSDAALKKCFLKSSREKAHKDDQIRDLENEVIRFYL